ncbi:short-chain dehydrogenase [Sphingopyxis bauzanensis]|uniref:Short-chain dehydrogenase n=1 Tax=Sphingopyxis bauzanensis TaxID=651663 RepID=A0A246JUQ8_9SPHN|nr:short-chain dehydrogenase [Sphingopyxis bauzanensis]
MKIHREIRVSNDKFDLTGKVAIIVGGTQGMGLNIAEMFAASGARIMICSRTAADTEAVSKSLNERFGNGDEIAAGCAADMTIKDQLQTVVDRTVAKFGKVTTLVASPTVRPFFGSSLDTPDEELDAQYLYVFKSRFWIASMCIREMRKSGGGSIIFIGSGSAFEATSERSVYSCIRAAEAKLIQNFAAEFGQENIRANIISPGLIDSSGAQALFQDPAVTRAFTERLPMKRAGTTREIASVATFLASEASSFTTGAIVPVDGGRNLHAQPNKLTDQFAPEKDARHRG